ncbi:hypothetical protein BST61_g3118 [Cercospora zeina]
MSQNPTIQSILINNTIRTYYALDKAMFKAHSEDRNEILGCSIDPEFLEMAKEDEFERTVVRNCRAVLEEAQAAYYEWAQGQKVSERREEQGELVTPSTNDGPVNKKKKKVVRRTGSSNTDDDAPLEELDDMHAKWHDVAWDGGFSAFDRNNFAQY